MTEAEVLALPADLVADLETVEETISDLVANMK